MIRFLITPISKLFTDAVFHQTTKEKVIALTIDDVGDESTMDIVQAIANHNQTIKDQSKPVKATFFVITSYLDKKVNILTKIQEQGHEIGNHGIYDHSHARLSPRQFAHELRESHQQLTRENNIIVKWFRPGRGRYNNSMLSCLQKMSGYYPKFALASFIPLDTFKLTSNPNFTINYLHQFIFPGAIWVFHGGSKNRAKNTATVLATILPIVQQKGYQIVTLSELFP